MEEGTLDISYIEASDRLVLREKFRSGVFENPYCEEDAFYSLDVSEEYLASPWEITDAAALARARNPETVEDLLEEMPIWKDNADPDCWYYIAVQEASISHYYDRKTNGTEFWTGLRPDVW